jgi:hypothetical protein
MAKYIQRKDPYGNLETVDEFESRKEAVNNLKEYRIYDTSSFYYISQKPCRDWQESYKEKS